MRIEGKAIPFRITAYRLTKYAVKSSSLHLVALNINHFDMKLVVVVLFTFLLVGVCSGAEPPVEKEKVSKLDPELQDVLGGDEKTQNTTESANSATNSTTASEAPPSSTNSTTLSTTEKSKKADDDDGPNLGRVLLLLR